MIYQNNDRLREYLDRGAAGAYREHLRHPRFEFNEEAFAAALDQVCAQFPDLAPEDAQARAAFRLLTSGVAPDVAVPLPSRWFRARRFLREKSVRSWPWLKLAWAVAVLVLCVTAVVLLSALVVRAEPTPQNLRAYGNALRGFSLLPAAAAPQQPGGIILQFQQAGSPLATRPAGLVAFNCSTGLNCSFSGSTFTLTSTGAGGTGCVPPGTPSRFLYDDGAGGCLDTGFTWTSGSSTATAPSGVTVTYSGSGIINARNWAGTGITNTESTGKIPIGNGDGTATWADPFVSGITAHDAVGTSTNPVLVGGYASAAPPSNVSADGDAVRAWFLRNGSQAVTLFGADGTEIGSLEPLDITGSIDIASLAGQGIDTDAGNSGAGTARVVIATNQSAIPISAASLPLPAGASTLAEQQTQTTALQTIDNIVSGTGANISQMNGVNVTMGNGASGAGVQRVTLASDSTGQVTANAGTNLNTSALNLEATQADVRTSVQLIDDVVYTDDTSTHSTGSSKGVGIMAAATPTDTAVNANDIGMVGMSLGRELFSVVRDAAGNNRGANVTAANELSVNCGNCTGSGASQVDNTAFTGGSSSVAPMGALYDTTPPAVTDGNIGAPRMDSSRQLLVNCTVGCGGSSFSDNAAFTFGTTAISPMGAVVDDTATNTVSENSAGTPRMSTNRVLYVDLINTQANSTAIKVDGSAVTQPVSGTVTTTPPANASTNVAQFGGTNVSTGTGAGGAGIPRVTLSNDSSLAANQSVNLAQVAGTNTQAASNGLNSTGGGIQAMQNVAQCDDTSPTAITENQFGNMRMNCTTHYLKAEANIEQVGGNAILTGNGATGTGSPRVTIVNDNTAVPQIGGSATGSAVPAQARYIGGNGTGNLVGYLNCDNTAVYDTNTNGSTQLVALTSSQVIYVCGFQISQSTTTAVSVNLRYGTGTNCATSPTAITPSYPLQAVTSSGPIGMVVMTPGFTGLKTAASNALCINTNAAVSVQAIVWYTKF